VLDAVEQLRATEVDRAREVWRKKFGQPPSRCRRTRQADALFGKPGFRRRDAMTTTKWYPAALT
jgi:SOS response regulatory protein OraA/RecX